MIPDWTNRDFDTSSAHKAAALGSNLVFLAMAYYMVKTASRSIILEASASSILPYVWIGSALSMVVLVPIYQRIAARVSRCAMLFGTLGATIVGLFFFYLSLADATVLEAALFFGFADVVGVLLIEQFWSLTNSEFRSRDARRWYGWISSGGLVGGLLAGIAGARLITDIGLRTPDLILVSILMLGVTSAATALMARSELFATRRVPRPVEVDESAESGPGPKVLYLVAAIAFLAQLCSPFIEFQFMTMVDGLFADQDERTVYLSKIFGGINAVALLINLFLTVQIHRRFGVLGGLAARPLAILGGSMAFLLFPVLPIAALLRVLDKAFAYSLYRASTELLYVPMGPSVVYRAKAWIDMLGFRAFKVLGSITILLLTSQLGHPPDMVVMSLVVVAIATAWIVVIGALRKPYASILETEERRLVPTSPHPSPTQTPAATDAAAA